MIESKMDQKAAEKDFPKLMICEELVVLFSERQQGMVVHSSVGVYPVGMYDESWHMSKFSDYHGTITLTA